MQTHTRTHTHNTHTHARTPIHTHIQYTSTVHEQLSLIEHGLATLDNMTEALVQRKSRKITVAEVDVLDRCEQRELATCDVPQLPEDDIQSPCMTDGVVVDKAVSG